MPKIAEVVQQDSSFSTLLGALQAADLVDALNGEGPLTVFAPTDDAFAAVDNEVLQKLLADKDRLTKVLTYHVAQGKYTADDLEGTSRLTTLEGSDLVVHVEGDTVRVDEATVIQADIAADNGVVHAIDQVILPERLLY